MTTPTIGQPIAALDIAIKQNATFRLSICLIEDDGLGGTQTVDTSGWDVVMQVRADPATASPVLLEASTANGRVTVGITGSPGEEVNIDVKIPATDTALLDWFGCAGYDLLAVYPGGDHDYWVQGQATLIPAYSWEP